MRSSSFIFFLLVICLNSFKSYSQSGLKDSTNNYIEISGFGSSTSRTPFWIQANQFGVIPRTSPAGSAGIGLERYWKLSNKETSHWSAGLGVEAIAILSEKTKVLLPQLNASIRYKKWELFVGRKKQWVGLADSTLGTGSYAWSGNALPMPKIQFGTRQFIDVPLTKGWVSFQAFYSDGIFESGRPVTSNLKLHQKALYLRLGKAYSILKLYGGINHQVQWGGNSPYLTIDGKMPSGFGNYINVVTGKAYAKNKNATSFDTLNRVGNHLGTIDLAMEIETFGSTWFIYRQNIYEDGSLFALTNMKDGLNGIRIRRKNSYGSNFQITEAVFEFLYTKNQGGAEFPWNVTGRKRGHFGRDNYFNNSQVRDGWSYEDRTIGTPFITPTTDTQWKYPKYADSFTSNNRVSVYHVGLKGTFLQKIIWTSKLSYSSNIGTYDAPFIAQPTQFSGLLTMQGKINIFGGTILKGSVAADLGDLYPTSYGFTLGLRKEGLLGK